jgi:hypothetical protein
MIGQVLEKALEPILADFAAKHGLYLDKKGKRKARKGAKVSWIDVYDNKHDLDFVLENGGTDKDIGVPVGFIESAWRRYTKHSRNKAQEIQGAIVPLVQKYRLDAPFTAVLLAGEFTEPAITQLNSMGFITLHFSHETVLKAFDSAGINARYGEQTPDRAVAKIVSRWRALPEAKRAGVAQSLIQLNREKVDEFLVALEKSVLRQIDLVLILPLRGKAYEAATVQEAMSWIEAFDEKTPAGRLPIVKYAIAIRYNNGNKVEFEARDKQDVIDFLRRFMPPLVRPAGQGTPQS